MKSVDWEKEPEFIALNESCVKGGADKRALPHYIRTLLSTQRKAILEMIPKKLDENWRRTEQEPTKDEQTFIEGFNECLLQVSKIIEE